MNPQIIHSPFKRKLARAFVTGAVAILLGLTGLAAHAQTLIYSDNFNVADTSSFDTASLTRLTGLLATSVVPQSGGAELQIQNGLLEIPGTGWFDPRMRFENTSGSARYDWSSGAAGAAIVASGGMSVSFQWIPTDSSGSWVSYCVGITPNSDLNLRVIDSGTDSGILFKNNGTYQVFKRGAGGASSSFTVLATNVVTIYYNFTSWAPGSAVNAVVYVNGNPVVSQSFTWTQTGGVQNMELAGYATEAFIGNFSVSSLSPVVQPPSLVANTTASPSTTAYVGSPVAFAASFSGTQPMTNQWKVNTGSGFVPITGATNSTLNLTNLQLTSSGAYALFVSNSAGATNSTPVTLTVLAAPAAISWNCDDNGTVTGPGEYAGVVSVANWNDTSIDGNQTANLLDNSGTATSLGFSCTTTGLWGVQPYKNPGQDADGTYNNELLNGYRDSGTDSQDSFTLTGIPYNNYAIYVYLSSDTAGRDGTVSVGSMQYDFSTLGIDADSGGNAELIQTTSTDLSYPPASYAVFTNLTGSGQTITWTVPNSDGLGIAGWQVVNTGPPPPPYLSLAADTTASPSANAYVGSAVTFSASFVGTQPITNQWKVNTGSGFVPITGATNTTLTLTNLQLANSGNYALFASNVAGSSNSTPVTLSVLALPANSLGINVQFTGSWGSSGIAPTQTGSAVIGSDADVWNTVSNPTGGTSPAGLATGTNLVLFDTGSIATPITMDYVADYLYNGVAFGFSNPFVNAGSPVANLMSGYMGSVTTTTVDTNTITLRHLVPGIYDLYLYVCGRSDGQTRADVFSANNQNGVVCGPNNGNSSLTSGVNYVHLTPTVTTNGVLNISYYGTADSGQGLLNGFQLNGPDTNISLTLSVDTSCDSPLTDYVGRTVTFSAAFAGSPAPSLQWEVDNGSGFVLIPGATNSVLTLANLQTSNSGNYALFATSAAGALNSTPLTLTVQTLPSPLAIDVQFDGTTYTGSHAAPQVGGAVIGNGSGSDYWNPVSNPNPAGANTNLIFGSLVLSDANNYGTPMSLTYTGASQDYNNGNNTPFNGSGSPAENLMQASLVTLNSNTASVTMHGIPAGVYDLYLYSSDSSSLQQDVTRFSANDSYDTSGPNDMNNVLTLEANYVHLTPTVTANGLLTISFAGIANGRGNLNGLQLSGPGATVLPPVACFTATPANVFATQLVAFTDTSSGNITNWVWNFGDGSSVTNVSGSTTHAYAAAGAYTVSLTANGPGGANTTNGVAAVTVYGQPTLGSAVLSAGSMTFSGTGGIPGAQYRILTSTDVALPLASWTPVATGTFASDGSYSYTQSFLTNAASFFLLVTP